MLRACILTLLLLGYTQGAPATSEGNKILTFSDRIAKVFGAKCLTNAGQLEYKELMDELNHLKKCIIFSVEPPLFGEELAKRCDIYSENVTQCLNKFVKNLEHCLDPKENYLKQFIIEVYNTSAKDFCDYTKMLSVTASLQAETIKCATKFKEVPEKNPHLVCYKNSTLIGDTPSTNILTKEELCADVLQADLCFGKLLEEQCPDSPKVKAYQRQFVQAGLKHCNDMPKLNNNETSDVTIEPTKETV